VALRRKKERASTSVLFAWTMAIIGIIARKGNRADIEAMKAIG
jgi:hypothetical protein